MSYSMYVPQRCGEPRGPYVNRPSVEYTGRGNDLICLAWNCRYFRSSRDDVKKQCKKVVDLVNGDGEEDGEPISISKLEDMLGIMPSDSGEAFGWSPSEDWPYPCFTFEDCGPGTGLYEQFGERVLMISIPPEANPYGCYWEV